MNVISVAILAVLIYALIKLFPNKPSFSDSSIVRSDAYFSRLASIHDGTISASPLRLRGWEGEMQVLFLIEAVGCGIVYWNVGVNFQGRKCEYDILVLSPFGILHVEVKAYAGSYTPAEGQPTKNPNTWKKVNRITGEVKESWSPVSQSLRAKKILSDTFSSICEKPISVETVVVFPDKSFIPSGFEDSRLPWFDAKNFQKFYRALTSGHLKNRPPLEMVDMAKIATCLGQCGFEPAFYDSDLLRKGSTHESD